jgi:general L-amino acid transport system permease protein
MSLRTTRTLRIWESIPDVPFYRDPLFRGFAIQVALCAALVYVALSAIDNAATNLARSGVSSGFGFWNQTAGFDISQTLIDYSAQTSTYGRAFWVGLLNTVLVAALGVVLATLLGFAIGIARLSGNFLLARLAAGYVELIRNIPLLLQLLFWYNAVLKSLPETASSLVLAGGTILNNRGLFLPRPLFADGTQILEVLAAIVAAIVTVSAVAKYSERFRSAIGARLALILVIVIGIPTAALMASGKPLGFDFPVLGRFNVRGGVEILPEFVALLTGLSIYTAAFIAEVVRAGLMAVPRGQTEAAQALGLTRGQGLRLIVIPQAMRVIIPPLTNQYLNLTKNSSLAVAIGYPDLVQIFTGTVLNQTNRAVEVVLLTLLVYLSLSLITSLAMNIYNWRMALVER